MNFSREEMETCCLTDSIYLLYFIDLLLQFQFCVDPTRVAAPPTCVPVLKTCILTNKAAAV